MGITSPSLEPGVLAPLASAFQIGQNDAGPVFDPAFSQVTGAMQTIHDSARLLGEAAESVKAARDPGAERRLRASASSRFASAQKTIDAATNAIDARRAQLEGEIDGDLNIPNTRAGVVENLRGNDIRARLRSLGDTKAFDTVRAAIAAGDLEAVSTVLAASPLASGIDYEQAKLLRSMAEEKFAPKRVAMRAGLEKLSATIARAGDVLASNYGHLLGEGDTREARKEKALRALEGGER